MKKPIKLLVQGFEYHMQLKPNEYKLVRQNQIEGKSYFASELEINSTRSTVMVHGAEELTGKETLNLVLSSVQFPTNSPFTCLIFSGIFSIEKSL